MNKINNLIDFNLDFNNDSPKKSEETVFYRFKVFKKNSENKKNTIGMAYLMEGQSIYKLKLWSFLNESYFLYPLKEDPSKFFIKTRELNKSPNPKSKYFWNVIGNGKLNTSEGAIELNFDLFEKMIFVSLYPENSATPFGQPIEALIA